MYRLRDASEAALSDLYRSRRRSTRRARRPAAGGCPARSSVARAGSGYPSGWPLPRTPRHAAPVRRGMRLAGRSTEASASGAASTIRKVCDDAYRAPGPARKADQGRLMHFGGDRSGSRMPEISRGPSGTGKGRQVQQRAPTPPRPGERDSPQRKATPGDRAASLPATESGWWQRGDRMSAPIQSAEKRRMEKRAEKRKARAGSWQRGRRKRSAQKKLRKPRSRRVP